MLNGYDPTDLSQSYPLRDETTLHQRSDEQSRNYWRDAETLDLQWHAPLRPNLRRPISRFEIVLGLVMGAAIASVWAYLLL